VSVKAFPSVNADRSCPGCGRQFAPRRKSQLHCRAGCHVLASRKRSQDDAMTLVLLARGIGWAEECWFRLLQLEFD